MMERLKKAAEGAALATEIRAKVTLTFSTREPVPNDALNAVLQKELDRIGPPGFDDTDQKFARAMQKELGFAELGMATSVMPFAPKNGDTASSDIGEVSAAVPLAELNLATRPLGTAAHHWAQTACAALPVGYKVAVAAKVLAASTIDALTEPGAVKAARDEFAVQTKGKPHVSPLPPDAKPVAPH
jgi:aminobenzoyl-glutamate utilization protein B